MDEQSTIPAQEPFEETPSGNGRAAKPSKKKAKSQSHFVPAELTPRIMVIGVGGAGGNAINNMIDNGLDGVEFVSVNTDAQALSYSKAEHRFQLGRELTSGLGTGGDPERGARAAEETAETLAELVTGAQMVFVACGMGGGTGTGAAPIIARIARECGALTVCVVTKPFLFEGPTRMRCAEEGLRLLSENVDAEIVIQNQNLYRVIDEDASILESFRQADEVLYQGVRSITDLMIRPGHWNLDFADVRAIMAGMGPAIMGAGEAEGDNRALTAAEHAIKNPLFDDVSVRGARSVLVNVASDGGVSLREVDAAVSRVRAEALEDAQVASGISIDPSLGGRIRVSVVATGVAREAMQLDAPVSASAGRVAPAPQAAAAPSPTWSNPAPRVEPQPQPQQRAVPREPQPAPTREAPQPSPRAPIAAAPLPQTPAQPVEPRREEPAPQIEQAQMPSAEIDAEAERVQTEARPPMHHLRSDPGRSAPPAGSKLPPLGSAHLSGRRPMSSTAPKPAGGALPEGPATGKALGGSIGGGAPDKRAERDAAVDPGNVDIPIFLRRHASQ